MTGTVHANDPIYSKLTFALMEDTGWYLPGRTCRKNYKNLNLDRWYICCVDYSKADEITWGKDAGCDFVKKSCMELMELEGERYFCSTLMSGTTRIFCNHDRTSVGSCNMVKYQGELPSLYQNFRRVPGVPDREAGEVSKTNCIQVFGPINLNRRAWLFAVRRKR